METQTSDGTALALAATAIFDGASNEFTLRSGKVVSVKPARMHQLGLIVRFFEALVMGIDPEVLKGLIDTIADAQQAAISLGKDPNKVDVQTLATVALVNKSREKIPLLSALFVACLDVLPKLVAALSNLTEEEFSDLEMDEGIVAGGAIFVVNYSFFTQSLPPLLTAFMRSKASSPVPATPVAAKAIKRRK